MPASLTHASGSTNYSITNLQVNFRGGIGHVKSTPNIRNGRFYFEVRVDAGNNYALVGIANNSLSQYRTMYLFDGAKYSKSDYSVSAPYGTSVGVGSVIGVKVDTIAGTIEFLVNNVTKGIAYTDIAGWDSYNPVISWGSTSGNGTLTANFGTTGFAYALPTGFAKYDVVADGNILSAYSAARSVVSGYFNPGAFLSEDHPYPYDDGGSNNEGFEFEWAVDCTVTSIYVQPNPSYPMRTTVTVTLYNASGGQINSWSIGSLSGGWSIGTGSPTNVRRIRLTRATPAADQTIQYFRVFGTLGVANTLSTVTCSVDKGVIHRDNVRVTGTISAIGNIQAQYRILVGGTQVYPASGYTALANCPISVDYTVPNDKFIVGNNQVTIEAKDSAGKVVTSSVVNVSKQNVNPTATWTVDATIHKNDVEVSGTLNDTNVDDKIAYRILVNGVEAVPWSDFLPRGYDFSHGLLNPLFTLNSNTVRLEVKDDFTGAVVGFNKTITKTNNLPNATVVYSDTVHLGNAVAELTVTDADGDACRYRVELNGVEKYPWSSFNEVPFQSSIVFMNKDLELGDNEVKVYIEDDFGGTFEVSVTISKVNNPPTADDFTVQGNLVKAVIKDADGDTVRYRILVNGKQLFPPLDYSQYAKPPVDVWYKIPNDKFKVGQSNLVKIEMMDDLGGTSSASLSLMMNYAGLLFHDVNREFYSTDVGEVLKYLDVGALIAGQTSNVYQVWLTNNLGYPVKDPLLYVNQRDLDGVNEVAEISYGDSPFSSRKILYFPGTMAHGDTVFFYVRVVTTEKGLHGGKFDIIVEADPM